MAGITLTRQSLTRLDDLVERTRAIIDDERFVPSKAAEAQRKRVFWRIGQAISATEDIDGPQGKQMVKSLGTRLNKQYRQGFGGPTLCDTLRTYRAFPDLALLGDDALEWKHYVELSRIEDEDFRSLMLEKTKERGWTPYRLSQYAREGAERPWEHGGEQFCDRHVLSYALAYTRTCGLIAIEKLSEIYRLDNGSFDEFDFQETMYYLRQNGKACGLPGVWEYQDEAYLVDRSLADALYEHVPYRSDAGYYYRDPYGMDREAEARETFLDELRIRRHQRACYDAERFARRQRLEPPKHLDPDDVSRGVLDSILCSHSAERLLAQLCNPTSSEIDPSTGLSEKEETVQHALSRLTRHISRVGLPTSEEVYADALFLMTLAGEPMASESLLQIAEDTLHEIYEQLPLWSFGGYSQRDLERLRKGEGASQAQVRMAVDAASKEEGKEPVSQPQPG